jgi:UDP-glucose 4-epimerase
VVEKSRIFDDGGDAAGGHRGECYLSRNGAANIADGGALNEPGVIAITGLRTFLGGQLAVRLMRRSPSPRIVGFDRRRPPGIDPRIRFHAIDLTAPDAAAEMAEKLQSEAVEVLVHAAFRTDATADLALDRALETDGSLRVIDACIEARVARMVLASSTMLYGPWPDNPNFLTEEHPLRGHPDAHLVANRIEIESLIKDCARRTPQLEVTVLRSCWVLGPSFDDRVSRYLALPVVPKLLGYDPMMQFVHEDDYLNAFERAALESHPGVFNVVGRGILPIATLLRLGGRRPFALPSRLLHRMAYYPGPRRTGDPPAAFYDYLRYLWIADGERGWDAFGEPVYSTREAWIEFVSARRSRSAG